MGAEVIILVNPYTYNFIKGLTHSAMVQTEPPTSRPWPSGSTNQPHFPTTFFATAALLAPKVAVKVYWNLNQIINLDSHCLRLGKYKTSYQCWLFKTFEVKMAWIHSNLWRVAVHRKSLCDDAFWPVAVLPHLAPGTVTRLTRNANSLL